jgi:hypothetical protein
MIEKDTYLICAALHDSNAYIRLQGAALLTDHCAYESATQSS